jgi:ABC-type transporter Mla subunit MlaD
VKKLGSLVFLLLLAAGVWLGARYFVHRGEIRATIVFHSAAGLKKGDPVVEGETVVGKVTKVTSLDGEDAVSVRLDRQHRRAIVGDSLFAIESHRLAVTNTLAVGAPIDDGTVLHVKEDAVSRWLAKHGSQVQPFIEKLKRTTDEKLDALDTGHVQGALDRWKAEVPDWKREGGDAVDRHLASIRSHIEKIEHELERSNRAAEARELKEKFEKWVDEVRK